MEVTLESNPLNESAWNEQKGTGYGFTRIRESKVEDQPDSSVKPNAIPL